MSEGGSFGGWVRRLLGQEPQEDQGEDAELVDDSGNVIKIPNRYKMCIQKSPSPERQPQDQMEFFSSINDPVGVEVNEDMPITITPSGHRLRPPDRPRASRPSTHKRVVKREKRQSVLRASVVPLEKQIIPPLTRLSVQENTADKLSKVLSKLDNMDNVDNDDDDDDEKK